MQVKLIECPRDAMQGIHTFIPTQTKIAYLNQLLKVGFDTLDFGSFVSAKAIPQLSDTAEVLAGLNLQETKSKLLAIVANKRGGEEAIKFSEIKYIGFPFSISETFQQRNTNSSISDSLETVSYLQNLCDKHGKELIVYISMGFGNPYGDVWNADLVANWVEKIDAIGVKTLSLSDTIGIADPKSISYIFSELIPRLPHIEFGAHLHTTPETWEEKIAAAWESGCRRFDGALKGYGGCPMAADTLTGNMPTEKVIEFLNQNGVQTGINENELAQAINMASSVFPIS